MSPCSNVEAVSRSFRVLRNPDSHKSSQFQYTLVDTAERRLQQDRRNFSIGHLRTFLAFMLVDGRFINFMKFLSASDRTFVLTQVNYRAKPII